MTDKFKLDPRFIDYRIKTVGYNDNTHQPAYFKEELDVCSSWENYPSDKCIEYKRELGSDANPEARAPLVVNNAERVWEPNRGGYKKWGDSSLAFLGRAPFSLNRFSGDQLYCSNVYRKAFPAGQLPPYLCGGKVENLFDREEGRQIHNNMEEAITVAASYYAQQMSAALLHTPEDVTVTRKVEFAQNGTAISSLTYVFDNAYVTDGRRHYDEWKQAQGCDKLEKHAKANSDVGVVDGFSYRDCFNTEPAGLFGFRIYYNQKKYDTSLVGKPEPINPVGVAHIAVTDSGEDGYVDGVWAWFDGAPGKLEIPKLSSYTASVLAYFDPLLANVPTPIEYHYESPMDPLIVHVKKDDVVKQGDPLFTLATPNGPETVRAEDWGFVDEMETTASAGRWLLWLAQK